jgi:hypothetical protein
MRRLSQVFLIASIAVATAACDSEPEAGAETQAAAVTAQPMPAADAPPDPTSKMARAVGDGKPGAAVDIRYDIAAKPEVGKPMEVQIAFVPRSGVEALDATISGMDGITIAGNLKPHFENVQAGNSYQHSFTLLPDRTGVYYLTVAVTTTLSGASIGRTFSIPFVVGTVPAQEKAAPPKDASGQAVESMKAE